MLDVGIREMSCNGMFCFGWTLFCRKMRDG